MSEKKKGWPVVGTIRKGEYGSYIKLEDNVTILVDGEEVNLNAKRTCSLQCPVTRTENLIKNGYIKENEAESKLEKAKEIKEWLKYEIIANPPRD